MEVVNNPAPNQSPAPHDGGSGLGFFLGAILLIIFAFLLFYYGVPAIRNNLAPAVSEPQTQSQPTTPDSGDTNVNVPVPDDIDINVSDERQQ
jgi:hypothetical protein